MATLRLRNLKKEYNGNSVIHGINLAINHGEFVVVVGPSGCGKSSILRMIAGLEEVTSGDIMIDRKKVNKLEPKDRNIAMVFQNYALYPHMTVYHNMSYSLRMRGISKKEIAERVAKTAESLELQALLSRYPQELSGGQRQRVAMGRALIRQPDIFLFDEPLSNLDAKLRVQMRLEIKRLQTELNITSVYVTHDQVEAMTLADRLVLINQGHIEQIGSPLAVYQHPASIFAAGFLGSPAMNLMPGRINADGSAVEISTKLQFALTDPRWQHYADQPVTVGFRPEHLHHRSDATSGDFELNIAMVESLGADAIIYGRLLDHPAAITARLPGQWRCHPGENLRLNIMPDSLHIFDLDTGMRL